MKLEINDIIGSAVAVVGSVAITETLELGQWIPYAMAAITGSAISGVFKGLKAQLKSWKEALVGFFGGAIGGYYLAWLCHSLLNWVFNKFGAPLPDEAFIPLIFFWSLISAALIESIATQLNFDKAVNSAEDKLTDLLNKEKK